MTFFGHTAAHCMQHTHFSRSTSATPRLLMWMASNLQALTQEPSPRQPKAQSRGPSPATFMAATQSVRPTYLSNLCPARSPPAQRTKATRRSTGLTSTPMMAAMRAVFSPVLLGQAFTGAFPSRMAAAQPAQPA